MASYPPPVDRLLGLGSLEFGKDWIDYRTELGLGPEHAADLIRLATDEELNRSESEGPEIWAPNHALRALGQLRAEEAVEPLLAVLVAHGEANDFLFEDLPRAFGMIGPAAIPATARLLADSTQREFDRVAAASALEEIGKAHPEARAECVEILTRQLARHEPELWAFNGFLASSLVELNAVESAPVIEAAFAADVVDEAIMGDWPRVRYELGLGPMPPPSRPRLPRGSIPLTEGSPRAGRPDPEKALKKKRKAQKRARKQHRRR